MSVEFSGLTVSNVVAELLRRTNRDIMVWGDVNRCRHGAPGFAPGQLFEEYSHLSVARPSDEGPWEEYQNACVARAFELDRADE